MASTESHYYGTGRRKSSTARVYLTQGTGEIIVNRGSTEEVLAVGEGFIEVTGDHVAILTDNAANSADIDESAAEEARSKAENRLKEGDISEEEARILNQAIMFSEAQIKAKRRRR